MPIVTRTLQSVQQSPGGTVLASFLAVDDKGREWRRSRSRFADEAAAVAASNAFDWTLQLQDREEEDAVEFIRVGGSPAAFIKSDLTATQFNHRLALRFWRARFEQDREFLCNVVDWITGFSAGQISSTLSITVIKAQIILDRATHIRDTICGALVTDDGRVGGV